MPCESSPAIAPPIVRKADPTQGGVRRQKRIERAIVAHDPTAGFDRARRNRIDRDGACAQFLRQVSRQHFDGSLHGRVGGVARAREARQSGGDVEDAAALVDQGSKALVRKNTPLKWTFIN